MVAAPVSCFAEEEKDYSYLEDMSIKEIKALNEAIDSLLAGEEVTEDIDTVDLEEMTVKELKGLKSAIDGLLGDNRSETSKETNDTSLEGIYYAGHGLNKESSLEFTPDNTNKTLGSFIDNDEGYIDVGEYRVSGGFVVLNYIEWDYQLTYQITENGAIIPTEPIIGDDFPKGDTFDIEWNTNDETWKFKSDGTFSRTFSYSGSETKHTAEGTYKYEDDVLVCETDKSTFYFYVYKDKIYDAGYAKE